MIESPAETKFNIIRGKPCFYFFPGLPTPLGSDQMQNVKMNAAVAQSRPNKFVSFAIILVIVSAAGMAFFNSYKSGSSSPATTVISQRALEETYGLRVNLVAVTGAGGFVDVRLKMTDAEKAKRLLSDAKKFPALSTETGVILTAPETAKSQKIKFDDDGAIYILYPNSGNAVRVGARVKILFGDFVLEPIPAK